VASPRHVRASSTTSSAAPHRATVRIESPPGLQLVGAGSAPLSGGVANRGRVFRIGNTVRRPSGATGAATQALLHHLQSVQFTGSPRMLEMTGDSELLSWIPGEAARTPLPAWALPDESMLSVARLVRSFHDAAASFDPSSYIWPEDAVPEQYRTSLVSHNDLHPGNIIFNGQQAVGLIDFDLAGPGGFVWDLAAATHCWCPLLADEDTPRRLRERRFDRFAMFLDAYGLDSADRVAVAEALAANHDWTFDIVRTAVRAGHEGFRLYWNQVGRRVTRGRAWLEEHKSDLIAAAR
jgi:hypothetical protein